MLKRFSMLAALAALLVVDPVQAQLTKELSLRQPTGRDFDVPDVVEEQAVLPAFPKEADLIEFHVSEGTANRFFIDGSSLTVGKDGIVRYALVVKTSGGATNTSYEGIRCKTGDYRLYASGRGDGTWAAARIADWRSIENKEINRHHAALNRDLFCPLATPINSADEGRAALRRSRTPKVLSP
jgi:hypothetical protein